MDLDQIIIALDYIATRLKEHQEMILAQKDLSFAVIKTVETAAAKLGELDERFARIEHEITKAKEAKKKAVLILHNLELKEQEDARETVRSLFNLHLGAKLSPQDVEYARNIGPKTGGPIKIVFRSAEAKKEVTSRMRFFKGKKYNVSEEYDAKTRAIRKQLIPILFKAREAGKYAILKNSDLFIEGKKVIVPKSILLEDTPSSNEVSSPENENNDSFNTPGSPSKPIRKTVKKKRKKKN